MRNEQQLLTQYVVYHRDRRNITTHFIGVPMIVFAIGGLHNCGGDACAALLASLGVVAAASAVVSGSIVIVGNIVYWFERQQGCPAN